MSLLCGLANVRLGWWFDSGTPQDRRGGSKLLHWLDRNLMVQTHLARELVARFHGTTRRWWYLSDGGHFENMGGYELIRRRLRQIVVVDGECDSDYTFEGLGNLVRMARVDFETEIDFVGEAELDGLIAPSHRRFFGSLDHLRRGRWEGVKGPREEQAGRRDAELAQPDVKGNSLAHAALARVTYPPAPGDPERAPVRGWLIYVKTTLLGQENIDLSHYHAAHPTFPHETTADQFFDEAQWESYRKLGERIGERLFGAGSPPEGEISLSGTAPLWTPADLFQAIHPGDREERAVRSAT